MATPDPLDLRAQERSQADAEERNSIAQQIEIDDLKWLMSNKRGRRFVARVLDQTGMHRSSFDTNNASMAFKEGVRWYGSRIKADIEKHCFDRYIEMLKESKE